MIDDQTLILYYYRDGLTAAQREQVALALAADPELSQRFSRLTEALDRLAQAPVQQPSAEAMARWRGALDGVAAAPAHVPEPVSASAGWRPWFAAAAVLVMGVGIGLHLAGGSGPDGTVAGPSRVATHTLDSPPQAATSTVAPLSPGVVPRGLPPAPFTRGLSMHLQEVQLQLVSLETADEQRRVELLDAIVAQNRLFAEAAERSGNADLARVLRAFQQVLNGMTAADASASDIDSERHRLLFEMAATLTKLSQPASEVTYEL